MERIRTAYTHRGEQRDRDTHEKSRQKEQRNREDEIQKQPANRFSPHLHLVPQFLCIRVILLLLRLLPPGFLLLHHRLLGIRFAMEEKGEKTSRMNEFTLLFLTAD
jgi:hypothetical protein